MTKMIAHRRSYPFGPTLTMPFDPFFGMQAPMAPRMKPLSMRTDIKETESGLEIAVDLPGFNKEEVKAELKDGRLTVFAQSDKMSEEKDANGTYLRKERFTGKCRRSFFIGKDVELEDVKAKFENGVLTFNVPKKQEQGDEASKHAIAIE